VAVDPPVSIYSGHGLNIQTMFNQQNIHGAWPTHPRVILASCDARYFDHFADRFRASFQKRMDLPVHLHLINPTETQITLCEQWHVTHTVEYISPSELDRRVQWCMRNRNKSQALAQDDVIAGYSQAVRFWLLGRYQLPHQSVVVADIDAVAVQSPTPEQLSALFNCTQFSIYKNRTMATFCVFVGNEIKTAQDISLWIEQYDLKHSIHNAVDQSALKKCVLNPLALPSGWISHDDTPTDKSVLRKVNRNIIFHSKGTRGKSIDLSQYL
jgi:hypothetical protein